MLIQVVWFVVGLVTLVAGASALVRGASKFALSVGISPLVVGLTVVAMGTSAPEVAVSTSAALNGQYDIAVGNVVGSNIFNVLFILGASALIVPLVVNAQIIRQEVPIMIGASLLLLAFGMDGSIGWAEGAFFLLLMGAYVTFLVIQSRRQTAADAADYDAEIKSSTPGAWDARLPVQIGLIAIGLVMLVMGADWFVSAAVEFARAFGVSELVIGLTIVAAGTSMPEVATSITAAIKGERDIAVGNVIGSNTFNILGCLGLASVVSGSAGLTMSDAILGLDIWVMLAVAMACLPVFMGGQIGRWVGSAFLLYYGLYVTYLILGAQQSAALPLLNQLATSVLMPLTILAFIVMLLRGQGEQLSK